MASTMAGVAAIIGLLAAAAEIRRRLMTRARVSRRLAATHEAKAAHFRFHLPWTTGDADPA